MATKGGGSLLGKADSTLAQMSYREAMADVGPDLKGVYSEDVKNQAAFEKGVQDHFDALYADNNALADELKTATTKAMEGLGTDYESMELFDSHLTSMKNRMKALPKNKKGDFERSKIRAELAQLQKSSLDLDNTITKLGTMIKAGDFNENATGPDNLALFNSIASGNAKKEIVNGNLIYSINVDGKTVKMDRQALNDALVQEDPSYQSDFNKIYAGENSRGKQKGTTFDRQLAINEYEASFPSEAAFAANIHKKQGSLKYSFAEALTGKDGSDSIYKALMDMGQTTINQYDANKDGKITNADFANKENGIALIDSLTNIHGGNFNYQAAKKAAAEFYADNISKKEFDDGVAMRPKEKTKEEEGFDTKKYLERGGFGYANNESGGDPSHPDTNKRNSIMNIGYVKQMTHRNSLLNLDEIPGLHYTYKHNPTDGWQAFYNNELVKDVTGADIARFEGLLSPIDIRSGKSYAMFNVGTKTSKLSQEQKEKAPSAPGGVGLNAIESPSVNQVRVNLQNILTPQFTTDFSVTPVYKSLYSLEQKGQVRKTVKNKIKITGADGFEKIYDIGPNATSEVVPSDLVVN